ncbi:hypothetical protein DTO021D3_3983 [Paecilomyces variotii]|nr:hypothetical protein DTO032I3_2865 [Paecilomyces variotii]KAJ9279224.1 hypothetical protein DTO021D3_3983 [Paecilomyces variotii]KAJ9341472.1 hypothetical protein DTO027B6_6003 [Paecilomyces variotii]KAJ9385264.1 hypothetical protein DTO032I4_4224 [Paecilomyces variotii]KAJ9407156.1 hypothetical protein DTO045G8_5005 [Paecilomyces variotii]
MTSREENVLAARDPSIDDENDWQEFSLTDVKVLIPGKSRYANLLTASADNPVRVTGSLDEVEEEQESLVLDEDYLSKRIVIDNVTHYAYGQHDDGEVGIWVAGQAGWYSITPARGYRPVFNEMVEAIDLLYFLADRHQRRRGKRKNWNPTVEYLCDEYVNHTHGICEDGDDSAEVFYKHHSFLISQMLNPKEGVNWAETNIFEHLCEKFPEEYERIKSKSETKTNNEEEEQDGQIETAPHVHDAETLARNQAEAIFKIILDLKEAGALAKRQLNLDLVASTLKDRFEIDTVEYAHDLITARATALIEMMDEAKTTSFDWSRKAIYRELKSAVENSDAQHVAITPLRPRAPIEDESSDSESEPEDNARGRRRRVRKSVLRPKIASVSSKQVGKRTRAAAAQELEMSDDSDNPADDVQTPSKVRGHELVRDPLSTRAKRRTRSILSDTDSPSVDRTVKQESNQPDALSHAADESQISADPDNPEPETWVCPVQGCDKVIHKAGTKRSKEMIQDHSLGHAEDTQSKLELVLAEQRLNINLSVDNLISRIRGFGSVEPL